MLGFGSPRYQKLLLYQVARVLLSRGGRELGCLHVRFRYNGLEHAALLDKPSNGFVLGLVTAMTRRG